MIMRLCSVRIIQVRFSKRGHLYRQGVLLAAAAAALAIQVSAQDLATLVENYREKPSVPRRAQLERLAAAHPKDQKGALARFALGVTSVEQKDYARAIDNLKAAASRIPKLE